jgi:hypothetical protein
MFALSRKCFTDATNNMIFSVEDKFKALAIVAAFETGSALGKFSTVAILNDGAGVSYGFCQFTHKSGALAAVIERYRSIGGTVGIVVIANRMQIVWQRTPRAIAKLAVDTTFRNALRAAGITDEMKQAQVDVALERFLKPAELECQRLQFTSPLALAVIHDSIVHGSWEKILDRITLKDERNWICDYVGARDKWLASVPRLAATRYRTRFFLNQIKLQNWELDLPLRANGVAITADVIHKFKKFAGARVSGQQVSAVGPFLTNEPQTPSQNSSTSADVPPTDTQPPEIRADEENRSGTAKDDVAARAETRPLVPTLLEALDLDNIETRVNAAAAKYDQVEGIATTVTTRNDSAKSLWTTVVGSVTQTFWALFGLFAGVPREVWLVVALIAAGLTVMYLYRQIVLGKIREERQ